MGNCKYCGQPAGMLRGQHKECEEKYTQGWASMVQVAKTTALGKNNVGVLESNLSHTANLSNHPESSVKQAIVKGWEEAVSHFLDDGSLSADEEKQLAAYCKKFGLTQSDLDINGMYTRFVQGAVLRDVMEGVIPARFHADGLPFNFQKSESLIWVFQNVKYLEDKTRREYVGGSSGISLRVAKGVYVRSGSFRGHPVETTQRTLAGIGIMAVTTKHIYFSGTQKNFRVPYNKIVSFMPFSDGVGIQRDATNAKPQIFVNGEGWFTYNLLMNVSNLG